jgi:RNA polymerase sigma-70 factor (ECF subfamily)
VHQSATLALSDAMLERPDFRELYDTHAGAVRSLARRLLGPGVEVDDLVHDVFLVAWSKRATLTRGNALSFLFGTSVRLCAGMRRRARVRRFLGLEKAKSVADWRTPERAAEVGDARRIVFGILDTLPEKRRTVFILHELQGMRAEEIAETLRIPVNTVWSRLRKARIEFGRGYLALEARNKRTNVRKTEEGRS